MMIRKLLSLILLHVGLISGSCPDDWVDADELGCLYFGGEQTTWLEASLFCESLNSSMVEILTSEDQDLLSMLSNLEIGLTSVDGWWVGLDDIGHESVWTWEQSGTVASFYNWVSGRPSIDWANKEDCVFIVPDPDKADNFLWMDSDCNARISDDTKIIAPLCQIKDPHNPSTEPPSTTTPSPCPASNDDWPWVPFQSHCYKLVLHQMDWSLAVDYCREEGEGDLVSIHSQEENTFLGDFILSSGYRTILIGLSDTSGTFKDWSWSDGTRVDFTSWSPGYPAGNQRPGWNYAYLTFDWGLPIWRNIGHGSPHHFVCKVKIL